MSIQVTFLFDSVYSCLTKKSEFKTLALDGNQIVDEAVIAIKTLCIRNQKIFKGIFRFECSFNITICWLIYLEMDENDEDGENDFQDALDELGIEDNEDNEGEEDLIESMKKATLNESENH